MGFELFGLRVQGCSQLVQFTFARKGYDNHHYHNKPQTGNGTGVWMTSCPEEINWEFGRFWKRFSWVSTMVSRSWGPTMVFRSWGPTMMLRSWGPTMMVRSWGPIMMVRSWGPTMDLKVDIGPWRQTVEFSIVALAVKFFGSRPARMNWDLKHHEMCRTLGVLLA